jgi:hypothetical protein
LLALLRDPSPAFIHENNHQGNNPKVVTKNKPFAKIEFILLAIFRTVGFAAFETLAQVPR